MRLYYKYDNIKEKLKDQNRLLEKIRANSHRSHKSRSTSKVRDMDYLSKNSFSSFLNELHQSFSIVFAMLEDAYQRDANLTHNLLESHYSSNGHLTVRKETHEYLERFKKEVILEKRF